MKLSVATIEALKNLSDINQGLFIEAGNTLYTMEPEKLMTAKITVPEKFPTNFGIYDLKKLITVLSVYENPEIEFDDKFLTISDGHMTTEFGYTDKSNIATPSGKLVLPSVDVKFNLSKADLKKILTIARAMEYKQIALVSDGVEVTIRCLDVAEKANRPTHVKMGFTYGKEFNLIFDIDHISKLLMDDYGVEISSHGFAQFTSKNKIYSIVLHKDSTYDSK